MDRLKRLILLFISILVIASAISIPEDPSVQTDSVSLPRSASVNDNPHIRNTKKIVWFSVMGVWNLFAVSTLLSYLVIAKNTSEFTYKSKPIAIVTSIVSLLFLDSMMVSEALVPYYPCFLRIWFSYCLLTVYCFSLSARGINYLSRIGTIVYKSDLSSHLNSENNSLNSKPSASKSEFYSKSVFTRYFRLLLNKPYPLDYNEKRIEIEFRLNSLNKVIDITRDRNYLICCLIMFIVGAGISAAFIKYPGYTVSPMSYDCRTGISGPLILLYVILYFFLLLFIPIIVMSFISKDAYGIRLELILTMTFTAVAVVALTVYNQYASSSTLTYATGYIFVVPALMLQHVFIVVLPLFKIIFENKNYKKLNNSNVFNSSRREQFDSLLAYPAGFSRLNQAALETFCPENVEFLKDYQLLKYCICSYIFRESSDFTSTNETRLSRADIKKEESNLEINYRAYQSSLHIVSTQDFPSEGVEIDMEQLIGGDVIPPLPSTIPDSIYKLGLMLDLNLINQSEGRKEKNTSKFTPVPIRLLPEFNKFYLKFLKNDALLAVNVPAKLITPIRNSINIKKFTVGMFDEVLAEVLNILYTNTFPIMLKTL
ncbi:hypothetical protein BB560_005778 [Smittium megazygosporum]|uniref:RGS domain-containing protein n=1 Tax=Smittium megazygosporum TaxID=133381 RepID=A0A2T9YXC2_9FUNG|nr:hypothetical protein BB560_005778 [Smittium megazygosporum]